MGSWYNNDTPELQENESEDDDNFGDEGGYSSDRAHSSFSGAWQDRLLRDEKMTGGKWGDNQNDNEENSGSKEDERTDRPKSPDITGPPLFSVPAAGTDGSPAGNTRMASRSAVAATTEKEQQKRRKM